MAPTAQPHDAGRPHFQSGWEDELQKLQAEVSHFQHAGSGQSPQKPQRRNLRPLLKGTPINNADAGTGKLQGSRAWPARLQKAKRFAAQRWRWQRFRPGVNEDSLCRSTRRIQRAWRELLQHRHLELARQQLLQLAPPSKEVKISPILLQEVRGLPLGETKCAASPDEDVWDEAIFSHYPSVDDMLSERVKQEAGEAVACRKPAVLGLVQRLRKLERHFQLRTRGSAPWRPPCALGESARQNLEEVIRAALDQCRGDIRMQHMLMPALCSLRLTVASSCMHCLELQRASAVLSELEVSLQSAGEFDGLDMLSQRIASRATLLRSRAAWLSGGAVSAEAAARDALQLLQESQDCVFWPPHPWELAACHRIAALSLCRAGRPARALGELQDLGRLLANIPGSLADLLREDVQVLQLEVEVAVDVDLRCADKGNVQSATLQAFVRRADSLLKAATHLPCACRLLALAARLLLLAEMPWYVASGARAEALEDASDRLDEASQVEPHRVLAAQAVCAVLKGDVSGAQAAASIWAESQDSVPARRLVAELQQATPSRRALSQVMVVCLAQGVCTPSAELSS